MWATLPETPKWVATSLASISDNATVIIISNSTTATNIALPSTTTTSNPAKKACTVSTTDGITTITPPTGTTLQDLAWTVKITTGESTTYKFYQEGSATVRMYLTGLSTNTGLRIGDASSSNDSFVLGSNSKLLKVTTGTRFVGPNDNNGSDWRTYNSETATNYKGAALTFYVLQTDVNPTAIAFKVGETTMMADGSTKNDLGDVASASLTLTPDQTADVYYTTDGTEPTTSSTKYTDAISITNPCTIWAFAKNSAGDGVKAKALFKFSRANGLAFGSDEYTAYLADGTFSTTLTNPNGLDVTYESLDEDVATVASDGTVTLKAAGETIISATFVGNDTYSAGSADYTLTVSDKTAAELAFASDFIHIEDPTYNSEISAPVALTNPHSVTVTYTSSDATVATVSSTGAITPKKLGTTTITASFAGDATYEASEVSYTLKLGLRDAGLAFDEDSYEMTYSAGANYTMDFIKDTDAAATFSSSNTDVATVNATTGEVTVVSVGETTITATTAKTSDYKAGAVSYTLTVTENTSAPAISAVTTVFQENVSKYSGSGDSNTTIKSTNYSDYLDCDGSIWDFSAFAYAYAGKEENSFKLGNSSNGGTIKTQSLNITGDATLTFKAMQFKDAEKSFSVTVSGADASGNTSITATSTMDNYTVNLTGATGNVVITIASTARGYVGSIKLIQSTTPTVSYTVPESGWGSYCSPYKLDLSNEATEIEAYAVTGFDAAAGTITFKKVEGVVPAKTPLVIKGESGAKKIAVDQTEATGTAPATNLLTGYLSPTYYDGDRETNTVFGMSDGNFHKLTAGTIPANRSVLSMSTTEANKVGAAEGRFTFIFDDDTTTGITDNKRETTTNNGECFNLAGQRVAQPTKGLYIVNGRKVVIK